MIPHSHRKKCLMKLRKKNHHKVRKATPCFILGGVLEWIHFDIAFISSIRGIVDFRIKHFISECVICTWAMCYINTRDSIRITHSHMYEYMNTYMETYNVCLLFENIEFTVFEVREHQIHCFRSPKTSDSRFSKMCRQYNSHVLQYLHIAYKEVG